MDTQDIFSKLTNGIRLSSYKNSFNESNKSEESVIQLNCNSNGLNNKTAKNKEAFMKEQIAHFRKINGIKVTGKNIPNPIEKFDELIERFNLSEQILKNVYSCRYECPTPIQMQVIPAMLQDRHVLACAPTGSGKSAAFFIPLLSKLKKHSKQGFRALILCPTRELSRQLLRECTLLANGTGIKTYCIGKVSVDSKKFGPNFSNKFDILISTPNRLIYLMKKSDVISFSRIEWLIVDESDKLFEAGFRSFRDQLSEIYKQCGENVRKAMFSATCTPQVAKWCTKSIKNILSITVGARNSAVQNVEQNLIYVGSESGKLLAFRDLLKEGLPLPVLIFVQSKERAKQLFNELIFDGINVDVIHSDRTQQQRDNVVKAFREGKIWVLISTELMGRGIDFKGVKLVVNYDFPPTAISYIHRIGRTGRAGRPGKAITYYTEDDKPLLAKIANIVTEAGGTVPNYLRSLKVYSRKKKVSIPKREAIAT